MIHAALLFVVASYLGLIVELVRMVRAFRKLADLHEKVQASWKEAVASWEKSVMELAAAEALLARYQQKDLVTMARYAWENTPARLRA